MYKSDFRIIIFDQIGHHIVLFYEKTFFFFFYIRVLCSEIKHQLYKLRFPTKNNLFRAIRLNKFGKEFSYCKEFYNCTFQIYGNTSSNFLHLQSEKFAIQLFFCLLKITRSRKRKKLNSMRIKRAACLFGLYFRKIFLF